MENKTNNLHIYFFPQHLCWGSPFLQSLSLSRSDCWNRPFPTHHRGTRDSVVVVVIVIVLYLALKLNHWLVFIFCSWADLFVWNPMIICPWAPILDMFMIFTCFYISFNPQFSKNTDMSIIFWLFTFVFNPQFSKNTDMFIIVWFVYIFV